MKNAIRIKDLKKSYGEQTVLDGFSCCFDDSTALMGASGKGKSTLLRLILGLEKAEEGQITTDVSPRFAVVFQEDRLFDSFDAIENVIVGFKGKIPREQATEFSFDASVHEIEDLKPGMVLPGLVSNITAFGAFVNIGVHQDGLVHISQLTDKFVSSPSDVVRLGQQVMVKVLEVDAKRRRISLTMKNI